ncbi:MAG: RNA polymerase sigma factor [Firmicutes bacterium]|nr:RNA polymerase sigma factor [Bacillota bacterium]
MKPNGESGCHREAYAKSVTPERIVRDYSDGLVRYAYSIVRDSALAEDAAADVIAAIFIKNRRFSTEEGLKAYLYRATHNRCIDFLRRRRREQPLEDLENVLYSAGPEQNYALTERNEALYRCLQKIPAQYREILILLYMEAFSAEQASVILKKNRKQVYNLAARAKDALRAELQLEGISYEIL